MRPADLADVVGVDSSSADSDSFDLPEDYGGSGGSDSSTSTSSVSDLEDLLSDNDTSDDEDSAAVRSVSQENRLTFHNVWHEEQKLIAEHRELRREHRRSSVSSQAAGAVAEGLGLRRDQLPRGRLDPRDIEMQQCSLPGCSNPGLNYFTQGGSPGTARCRFSVAFSGGGIRAAAFQAGALWRLAESGHLRDIDYIAAVSGGSYIAAAFASHILEAGRPPPGENVDAWYRDIVARTICRMQRNTPYLARDMGKNPWGFPKDGSSLLPRIFDIPILLTLFIINTVMTPAFYAIFILVPGVELFNMFVGGEMRWMFCDEGLQPGVFELFYPPKIFNCSFKVMTLALFCTFLGLTFLFWFLARVPLKDNKKSQKLYRRRRRCWLFMKSSSFVFTRIVMILVAWYMMMLIIINYRMWWSERGGLNRLCMCHRYSLLLNTSMRNQYHCSDTLFNTYPPWYETPHFNATKCQDEKVLAKVVPLERNDTVKAWGKCGGEGWHGGTACKAGLRCTFRNRWYSQCVPSPTLEPPLFVQNIDIKHPMQTFMVFWLIGFLLAILLIPFFPKLYGYVLGIAGPLSVFIVLLALVDRRVFGALYGGEEEAQTVDWIARSVLILDVVLLPFQHIARGCCHRVYRRSLRKAFFANGQDSQWGDLSSNPYCPFLLITATINEYMRPGDSIPLSEISLSPLHVGSVKTGYIDMLAQRSLSRSVALSGAAIDAFVLGKNDHIKYRFWLEMMSLSMGDFMLFDQKEQRRRHSERGTYIMLRLPALLIGECFYGMMLFGDMSNYSGRCRYTHLAYSMATLVALVSIFLSFFAWLPCLDPLLHCLPIRGIHLLTRFYHRAETPPSLVCVTDGGLLDNTGVMQLLRRQSRRILLVYGGNDPKGKFKWLRKVLEAAGNERLASFHDPHDPGRDFREIIQDFNEDKDRPYLHLRIRYGWRRHARRPHGDLFIVTNRLPAECTDMKVEPLLTEVEIRGQDKGGEVPSDMEDLRQTDLAGCCCDCCHSHRCNFGPKFPNVHQMNQCLTPQLFNSLCRMGRRASKDAVGTVAGPPRRSSVRETGGEMP